MKKRYVIIFIFAFVTSFAFAQDSFSINVGAGGLFDFSFNNGAKDDFQNKVGYRNLSYGAYAFFDATYVELGFSYSFGSLTNYVKIDSLSEKRDAGTV